MKPRDVLSYLEEAYSGLDVLADMSNNEAHGGLEMS